MFLQEVMRTPAESTAAGFLLLSVFYLIVDILSVIIVRGEGCGIIIDDVKEDTSPSRIILLTDLYITFYLSC